MPIRVITTSNSMRVNPESSLYDRDWFIYIKIFAKKFPTEYTPFRIFIQHFLVHQLTMKKFQIFTASILLAVTTPLISFAASGDAMTATGISTVTTIPLNVTPGAPASDALNVPGSPKLISKTATSITIEWSKVNAAKGYIVKYSKTSVAQAFKEGKTNATYDMESDQVTSTGTTISNLKTDTTYYFAVVAIDAMNNESTTNSEELSAAIAATDSTGSGAIAALGSTFKLSGVTVVNNMTINADFSAPLSATPVTVKFTKTIDASNILVKSVTVDPANPTKAIVNLGTALDPSSSYSLVVIQAKDVSGASISQGINAVKEFTTTANLVKVAAAGAAMNGTGAMTASGTEVTLNAALPEGSGALAANGPLPATGTQETLLMVLAAILAFLIVYGIRARKA